jgi:hypothetical protein
LCNVKLDTLSVRRILVARLSHQPGPSLLPAEDAPVSVILVALLPRQSRVVAIVFLIYDLIYR